MKTDDPLLSGARTRVVRAALAAVAACALYALSACNTTEGAGKDIENLGDNIEDAARDAKK